MVRDATSGLAGQRFSADIKKGARSAASEEVRGNPLRVSPAPALEGSWIEIFRAGDYADRGRWTPEQLDQLATAYDPRLHAAPVVLGHPADDAPAYAWVRRLRRAGQSLWAQLEKVDPAFEALLRAGRFAQRSVALYTRFPPTGGPYLRHLGFLGAAPPAVKGLAPVRPARRSLGAGGFAEIASVTFPFDNPALREVEMSEPKPRLEHFLDHLRAFFTPQPPLDVIPSEAVSRDAGRGEVEEPAFSDRLAALEQRLDALTATTAVIPSGGRKAGVEGSAFPQVTAFVESLRAHGRFPPAFERWGVPQFLERLADADASLPKPTPVIPSEAHAPAGDEAKDLTEAPAATTLPLLAWFQDFLAKLPAVIEFGELAGEVSHRSPATGHRSPIVRFTEPRRGVTVDPASVELAERAEALAAELDIPYAEALARLRQEHRTAHPTA